MSYDDQDPMSKESFTDVHPADSCVICNCASLFDDLSKK